MTLSFMALLVIPELKIGDRGLFDVRQFMPVSLFIEPESPNNTTDVMSVVEKSKSILSLLPDKPGVYQFIDSFDNILYVGKAKNLKKRVTSYFSGNQSGKTMLLLKTSCGYQTYSCGK